MQTAQNNSRENSFGFVRCILTKQLKKCVEISHKCCGYSDKNFNNKPYETIIFPQNDSFQFSPKRHPGRAECKADELAKKISSHVEKISESKKFSRKSPLLFFSAQRMQLSPPCGWVAAILSKAFCLVPATLQRKCPKGKSNHVKSSFAKNFDVFLAKILGSFDGKSNFFWNNKLLKKFFSPLLNFLGKSRRRFVER